MMTKELLRKITIINTILMIVFYNSIAWFFGDSVPFYRVSYFILYAIFSNLTGCVVYLKEKGESEDLIKKMLWFSLTGLFFIAITTFVNRDFQFEYVFAIGSILSMYYIYTTNYDIAFGKFTVDLKVWKKITLVFLIISSFYRAIQIMLERFNLSFLLFFVILMGVLIVSLDLQSINKKYQFLMDKSLKTVLIVLHVICTLLLVLVSFGIFETRNLFDRIEAFLFISSLSLIVTYYYFSIKEIHAVEKNEKL